MRSLYTKGFFARMLVGFNFVVITAVSIVPVHADSPLNTYEVRFDYLVETND